MSAHFSFNAPVFNGIVLSSESTVVGYASIIQKLNLEIPFPDQIAVISSKALIKSNDEDRLIIHSKSYQPEDDQKVNEIEALYKHLVFALKYEGVNLLVISALTRHYDMKQLGEMINIEPTGRYSRRLWFLIEWVLKKELPGIQSISKTKKSYVNAVDEKLQYGIKGEKSPRHLVINNLPGVQEFCPLVRKTSVLERYHKADLSNKKSTYLHGIRKDLLLRASAFLLLKDSKASFTIEGESPKSKRAALWGNVIGQAGTRDLSHSELHRLQQQVIENPRFLAMGYRTKGGFVGEHDRQAGTPLPEHISAKHEDLEILMQGFIDTAGILTKSNIDGVIAATIISFGFVFIHPFEDGNGRIHRYLIHHVLSQKEFSQQGVIFPVSASILNQIDTYRKVLEHYSHPLLSLIDWEGTKDHNVKVLNDTIDFYKFYDATKQAEFLYDCVNETIDTIIPEEVEYLRRFEEFKSYLDDHFEMPDRLVNLLVRFLDQADGKLSKRAKENEFDSLAEDEVKNIEKVYAEVFINQ